MPVNSVAENVLGTIGTICWTCLSHLLVLIWGVAALPLGVYNIIQDLNIPLQVQPQLFGFLSLFSWGQCLHYDKKKSRLAACLIAGSVMIAVGALEAGMVFAIRPSMNRRAIDFFGIFASVIIALGLLPQYWEIWQRKEVIGISMPFMIIDITGGIFSCLSLIFRPKFDVVAAIAYILVVVLDGFIVIAALILNPRARRRRRLANEVIDTELISSDEPGGIILSSSATTVITVPASGSSIPSKPLSHDNYSEKC